jgi:two-component system, NarL family, sensor histidine kinase EvgS
VKRIALVDDNADSRRIVHAILEGHYEVVEYGDAAEAYDDIRRQRPDLVLVDLSLPGRDGFWLLRELREVPAYAEVPIVAMSASIMAGDDDRLRAAGFAGVLTKPIVDEALLLATLALHLA